MSHHEPESYCTYSQGVIGVYNFFGEEFITVEDYDFRYAKEETLELFLDSKNVLVIYK